MTVRFSTLLYRYLFFDWLFADISGTRDLFERSARWRHNRAMRRHLPTYLRRWSVLALASFGLGSLSEQLLAVRVAACCFTGCAMLMSGMAFIAALWLLLARAESP